MFHGHRLVSDQVNPAQLHVIWRELSGVLHAGTAGDVVGFGCYTGTTSLFLRRLLDETDAAPSRQLHVYDSFAGLPPKQPQDASGAGEAFQAGTLTATRKQLLRHFHEANLQPPIIHKGWFDRLTADEVPARICFAFLDGDFYDSIMASLSLVWPRLQAGATVVVDDYQREALPGVQRAVQDYFKQTGQARPAVRIEQNLGIIRL